MVLLLLLRLLSKGSSAPTVGWLAFYVAFLPLLALLLAGLSWVYRYIYSWAVSILLIVVAGTAAALAWPDLRQWVLAPGLTGPVLLPLLMGVVAVLLLMLSPAAGIGMLGAAALGSYLGDDVIALIGGVAIFALAAILGSGLLLRYVLPLVLGFWATWMAARAAMVAALYLGPPPLLGSGPYNHLAELGTAMQHTHFFAAFLRGEGPLAPAEGGLAYLLFVGMDNPVVATVAEAYHQVTELLAAGAGLGGLLDGGFAVIAVAQAYVLDETLLLVLAAVMGLVLTVLRVSRTEADAAAAEEPAPYLDDLPSGASPAAAVQSATAALDAEALMGPGALVIESVATAADTLPAYRLYSLQELPGLRVEGVLPGDVDWPGGRTYLVIAPVTVSGSLRIGAGAQVIFYPGTSLFVEGGALTATGTAAEPVRFLPLTAAFVVAAGKSDPARARPHAGAWQGLRVGDQSEVSLTHCVIDYAVTGVQGGRGSRLRAAAVSLSHNDTAVRVENVELKDAVLADNGMAVAAVAATVDNAQFRRNLRAITAGADLALSGCEFSHNGTAAAVLGNADVARNHFTQNHTAVLIDRGAAARSIVLRANLLAANAVALLLPGDFTPAQTEQITANDFVANTIDVTWPAGGDARFAGSNWWVPGPRFDGAQPTAAAMADLVKATGAPTDDDTVELQLQFSRPMDTAHPLQVLVQAGAGAAPVPADGAWAADDRWQGRAALSAVETPLALPLLLDGGRTAAGSIVQTTVTADILATSHSEPAPADDEAASEPPAGSEP